MGSRVRFLTVCLACCVTGFIGSAEAAGCARGRLPGGTLGWWSGGFSVNFGEHGLGLGSRYVRSFSWRGFAEPIGDRCLGPCAEGRNP